MSKQTIMKRDCTERKKPRW